MSSSTEAIVRISFVALCVALSVFWPFQTIAGILALISLILGEKVRR